MKKGNLVIYLTLVILIWHGPFSAVFLSGSLRKEVETIYPLKVPVKIKIDGSLDDDAWKSQPLEKHFISFYPNFGEVLSSRTLIWMVYDDQNLYFAFLCCDEEPHKIKTSIIKRDYMFEDDWIAVSLDALGNKQNTYNFYCNPNGIQGDILDSTINGQDRSPDFVWESAAKLTEKGYQVEMRIPLRSISFKSGKEVKMGIQFKRKISRLGISASWPQIEPQQGRFNAFAAIIYKNLKSPLKLELLPFITHARNKNRMNLQGWETDTFTDVGIGLKYGITSSISADFTINPDFSQVESDTFQVEVNQRYPLFYAEKRPFFMEGLDIFSFFTVPGGYLPTPVHTRRIVDPLWGAKITGTVGKITFGLLSAVDKSPVSGKTFFGIARGKYCPSKDNYIGFLYSGHELIGKYNRVWGADISYRLFSDHKINASFLHSISGGRDSRELQHTNSSDFNLVYSYLKKHLGISAGFEHVGRNFRMDSSFLKRTGLNDTWFWTGYFFYPKFKKLPWLKQINPTIFIEYLYDLTSQMEDPFIELGLNFSFTRQGLLVTSCSYRKESWQGQSFEVNQFNLIGSIQLTKWLQIQGNLTWGDHIHYEATPSYKGKSYTGRLSFVIQLNKNLNQQFSFFHSDLYKNKAKIYNVNIFYSHTTYQFNRYLFFRAVVQYNSYQKIMLTDFLASFTLVPGTVLHVGYGGLYENREWQNGSWVYRQGDLNNIKRSFFAKISYLWRF